MTRSRLYAEGFCLQDHHVELVLDDDEVDASAKPQWEQIFAQITLDFCKGHKDIRNKDFAIHLRPLTDMAYIHICSLALLMTHALRYGLVGGTTLDQILEQASNDSASNLSTGETPSKRAISTQVRRHQRHGHTVIIPCVRDQQEWRKQKACGYQLIIML